MDEEALKIVVIDDSDFSRKTIVSILKDEGYNIIGQASNAKDGVSLSGSANADLYIIDVVMPGSSGIEVAEIIKNQANESYVIMISSLNSENIIIESITSGAIDFLTKPFLPEDLLKSVKKVEQIIKE